MIEDSYTSGGHWAICDVCGFKVRWADTRKRWDGVRVCKDDWEPRHEQDSVRGKKDRQAVRDPRPEPVDTFIAVGAVTEDNL